LVNIVNKVGVTIPKGIKSSPEQYILKMSYGMLRLLVSLKYTDVTEVLTPLPWFHYFLFINGLWRIWTESTPDT
jgi:hypothetical protein